MSSRTAKTCCPSQTQIVLSAHEELDFTKENFIFDRQDWKVGATHLHYCGVYHLEPKCKPAVGTELYFFNESKAYNIISAAEKNIYGNFWHIYLTEVNDYVVLRWIGKAHIGWEIVASSPNLKVHSLNVPGSLLHTFCTVRGIPTSSGPLQVTPANPNGVRDFLATVNIEPLSPVYNTITNFSWGTDSGLQDPGIEYHHGDLAYINNQLVVIAGSLRWDTQTTPDGGTNLDMHYAFPENHPNHSSTASAINVSRALACAIHTTHQNPYTGDLLCSYLGTPGTTRGSPSDGPGGFINVALKPLFPDQNQGVPVTSYHVIGSNSPAELGPSTLPGITDDWNYDFAINHCTGTLVSSSWGPPSSFDEGFSFSKPYGRAIRIYKMPQPGGPTLPGQALTFITKFVCDPVPQMGGPIGGEGVVPLEVRRLHHPEVEKYFVGITLPGAINYIWKDTLGVWQKKNVITPAQLAADVVKINIRDGSGIPAGCPVLGAFNNMPTPLVTDITLSQDDKYLYVSAWLGGALLQYDVSDPLNPLLADGVGNLGGVKTINPYVNEFNTSSRVIKGSQYRGGPQMLRLSPDGRRLFVTNSLYSSWDDEFYPSGPGCIKDDGGNLICLNTGVKRGEKVALCSVDNSFGISFSGLTATMNNGEIGIFRSRVHESHIRGVTH